MNIHSMVVASQKGARLGATAPVEMLSFTRLVALFAKNWTMWFYVPRFKPSQWLFKLVGWIKPFIPRILKSFLIESHWNTKKKWHMFGISNFFQELQRQRAMAEAYWGLLCTIASWSWLFSLCLAVAQEILARISASIARAGRRLLLAGLGMSWVIFYGHSDACHDLQNRNHVHMLLVFLLSGLFSDISESLERISPFAWF